jgi:hypothetical protein
VISRGLHQIPAGICGSTCQRSEVKVKLQNNDHEMSGWQEGGDMCVCACAHTLAYPFLCSFFIIYFNVCYQHILICQLLFSV